MIRTQTLLFPEDSVVDTLLLWAALATMVIGIFGAMAQTDIKRMLSFILVSHIGYMVFGIGLASVHGMSGAVFYVAHHITVQTTLFLVAGLVERRCGSSSLNNVSGLAKISPVLGVLFFIPAMNLAGIPPLSGFLGKLGLIQAGVQDGSPLAYLLVGGAVATSLLTLYSIVRLWNYAFWRAPDGRPACRARHPAGKLRGRILRPAQRERRADSGRPSPDRDRRESRGDLRRVPAADAGSDGGPRLAGRGVHRVRGTAHQLQL